MEGTTEKDCSPLWTLYQQIVADMKNSTPMWEEFISKATKLHSALKSALVAVATFLDAFQKIADAATNARGATKDIGTALTRVCLRHRAIETRMKTFIGVLMDTLITPLSERAEDWRRGPAGPGALSREHARECKRARAELRRRAHDAQRHARKTRRAPDAKRRADVSAQDVQERREQLGEMEERAVKAALVEERSRFCHFVSLLNPVVECEVAMLEEVEHLQEGSEQLLRHTHEPNNLPPASLQVICDLKSCYNSWAADGQHSPSNSSRLGSRKSSLTSISSMNSQGSDPQNGGGSTVSCSTPISNASSVGTLPGAGNDVPLCLSQGSAAAGRLRSVCSADSGFRSQDALHRQMSLYVDNGSDNQSVSSECTTPAKSTIDDDDHTDDGHGGLGNAASATWPDLKDTAQFERAASAIMAGRPHTISAAYERGHARPALSVHTFTSEQEVSARERDGGIYARPPLPTRCSSLERPAVPAKSNCNTGQHGLRTGKPSSLPPHLTKDMPQALYVNMSELATLAATRAQQQQQQQQNTSHEQPQQEKVCSESSASESSLESSSGYGSQGAFAGEDQALQQQLQQAEGDTELVTLRRDSVQAARDCFSISLGSLEEAVRSLDEACEVPAFATIGKKPSVPKRRPLSMTATVWSRRGSSSSLGKPPPPVRRSSSISRPQRAFGQGGPQAQLCQTEADNLPPPPAFLLQPDGEANVHQSSVAETVKQLTELKHMPASPGLVRRMQALHSTAAAQQQPLQGSPPQHALSTFQQAKNSFTGSNLSLNNSGNLNPIYGQTGHRILRVVEQGALHSRGASPLSSPPGYGVAHAGYGVAGYAATPGYDTFSSFGPRTPDDHHVNSYKLQDCGIYATPTQHELTRSPPAPRRPAPATAARAHSADRRRSEQSSLIASLSAKLAPQLSPRTTRRAISSIAPADPPKGKGTLAPSVQPAFLDKLSATIQKQRRQLDTSRANTVRDIMNSQTRSDPRVAHTSLMEQIKRGATLKRNKQCNDRSAPKIR